MNTIRNLLGICVVGLMVIAPGCQGPPAGELDTLDDANGNGYGDVTPPETIVFDVATNLKVSVTNSIDQGDVAALAERFGIDPSLLNLATITADMTLTLDYGDGIVDVLRDSEPIAPFQKNFEVACPISVDVAVVVTATAPVVGSETVAEFSMDITEGVEYECGQTIDFETYIDENGDPASRVEVS